jgi:hypothetical protein
VERLNLMLEQWIRDSGIPVIQLGSHIRNSEFGTHRQQRFVAVAVGVAGPTSGGPERVVGRPYGHSLVAGSHNARRASVIRDWPLPTPGYA